MFTFIAYALTFLGCLNWLMIGLLQYDYVAGLFGWQSSVMSRLVYIAFGIGAIYLSIRLIVNKGSVKIWEKRGKKASGEVVQTVTKVEKPKKKWQFWKKKTPQKVTETQSVQVAENEAENVEEIAPDEPFSTPQQKPQNNLFDEHLNG